MAVDLGEVEACVRSFRKRLQEDKEELQDTQEKVLHINNALFQEFPDRGVPGHLSALFVGEERDFFPFPFQEDEGRRKRLAQERREEYNTFLRRKEEKQVDQRKKVGEEVVLPRSILEAVDYEKVLARMKAEEAEFRNLNRAEPSLDKSASIQASPVQKYVQEEKESFPMVQNSTESFPNQTFASKIENGTSEPRSSGKKMHHTVVGYPTIPNGIESLPKTTSTAKIGNGTTRPESSGKKMHHTVIGFSGSERRGGGGDPLRDSSGNLITTRGYVTFPSEQQNTFKSKQVSYREELRRQIEEKQALEAAERRRQAEEDEAVARRSEEQRLQMQREYEEEQRRTQRKSEQRDRERLRQLEEFQTREAASRQKRAPPPEARVELPILQEVEGGRQSPPIPAVRSKTILASAPPQPLLVEVRPENVFSSLSEIRRSLMQEHSKKDFKNSYEVMNRRTVLEEEEEGE